MRHTLLREKYPDVLEKASLNFPAGWAVLVDAMLAEVIAHVEGAGSDYGRSDIKVSQIKDKNGALDCYMSAPISLGVDDIVTKYEAKAEWTCEVCGQYGRKADGKWNALCEAHAKEQGVPPLQLDLSKISTSGLHIKVEPLSGGNIRAIVVNGEEAKEEGDILQINTSSMMVHHNDLTLAIASLLDEMLCATRPAEQEKTIKKLAPL